MADRDPWDVSEVLSESPAHDTTASADQSAADDWGVAEILEPPSVIDVALRGAVPNVARAKDWLSEGPDTWMDTLSSTGKALGKGSGAAAQMAGARMEQSGRDVLHEQPLTEADVESEKRASAEHRVALSRGVGGRGFRPKGAIDRPVVTEEEIQDSLEHGSPAQWFAERQTRNKMQEQQDYLRLTGHINDPLERAAASDKIAAGEWIQDVGESAATSDLYADPYHDKTPIDKRLSERFVETILVEGGKQAPNTVFSLLGALVGGRMGVSPYATAGVTSFALESGDIYQEGKEFLTKKYGGKEKIPDIEWNKLSQLANEHGAFNAVLDAITPGNQIARALVGKTMVRRILSKAGAQYVTKEAIKDLARELPTELLQEESTMQALERAGKKFSPDEKMERRLAVMAGIVLPTGAGSVISSSDAIRRTDAELRAEDAEKPVGGVDVKMKPVSGFATPEQMVQMADDKLSALIKKRDGTLDQTVFGEDGKPLRVRGEPKQFITPEEKAEIAFLEKTKGNAEALAKAYNIGLETPTETAAKDPWDVAEVAPDERIEPTMGLETAPQIPTVSQTTDLPIAPQTEPAITPETQAAPTVSATTEGMPTVPISTQAIPEIPTAAIQRDKPGAVRPTKSAFIGLIESGGGINREEAEAQGIDPALFKQFPRAFPKNGGMTFDEGAEMVSQSGFGAEQYSANEFLEMLDKATRGGTVLPTRGKLTEKDLAAAAGLEHYLDAQEAAQAQELARQARSLKPVTESDLGAATAEMPDYSDEDLTAGQRFEEQEYDPAMGGEARALFELHQDAKQYDETAADGILESQQPPSEIARGLYQIIQEGKKRGRPATEPRAPAGAQEQRPAAQAPAVEPGAVTAPAAEEGFRLEPQQVRPAAPAVAPAPDTGDLLGTAPSPTQQAINRAREEREPTGPYVPPSAGPGELFSGPSPEQLDITHQERRHDAAQRKKVSELTPDEMRRALLLDDLTGLPNRRAYEEAEKKSVQVAIDADSLKFINDTFGHESGDKLLQAIAQGLSGQGLEAYRISGDEFMVQGNDQTELESHLDAVVTRLDDAQITAELPDGTIITKRGIHFSYGIGATRNEADKALNRAKQTREAQGLRAARGQEPQGVTRTSQRQPHQADKAPATAVELAFRDAEAKAAEVDEAAHEAATSTQNDLPEPTVAMKEVGNYKKGKINISGMDISIENPEGSKRKPQWKKLKSHYGYIARVSGETAPRGTDKDHIDIFIKPGTPTDYAGPVFVIDQVNKDGTFDEAKVMLGFDNEQAAREGYLENYTKGWTGLGAIKQFTLDEFKDWLKNADTKKPVALAEGTKKTQISTKLVQKYTKSVVPAEPKSEQRVAAPVAESQAPAPEAGEGEVATTQAGGTPSITEDAGAELTANKRNRMVRLSWDDIKDKDAALRVRETTKNKVYPRPDYQVMVDGGMQPLIAHIVKQAYDALASKPNTRTAPTDAQLEAYIIGVNRYMDGVMAWANDKNKVSAFIHKLAGKAKVLQGASAGVPTSLSSLSEVAEKSMLETVYPDGWRNSIEEVRIIGGNKTLASLQPSTNEAVRAMNEINKGWPSSQEAWQRQGYRIVKGDDMEPRFHEGKRTNGEVYVYAEIQFTEKNRSITVHSKTFDGVTSKDDPVVQDYVRSNMDELQGKYLLLDKRHRTQGAFDTEDAAKEKARELTAKGGKKTISDKGISVTAAERTGQARRMEGEDISSDKLLDTFGFKGVNFGNWMKGKGNEAERQLHLNHAYDSFLDLAELLGVPPKAMSLNGMLGLAIGAQGTGQYAAHFVPGVNEINLTRTSGAGSLAHEFAHAVDHYFARLAGLERKPDPFLTSYVGLSEKSLSPELRQEMLDGFKAIVKAMNTRPETEAERNLGRETGIKRAEKNVSGWLDSIRRDFIREKVDEKAFDALADKVRNLDLGDGMVAVSGQTALHQTISELRELYKTATGRLYALDRIVGMQNNVDHLKYLKSDKAQASEHIPQTPTDYSREAAKLDKDKGGKPYWNTPWEKFARAFDAYISDKLEAKAAKNTYLSHAGRTGETVPKGEERETINAAFDKLVGEIKTKETDQGTALFSRVLPQTENIAGLEASAIEDHIAPILKRLKTKVPVTVVESYEDLPPAVYDRIKEEGVDVQGVAYDGNVYLVSSQIPTLDVAERVLLDHELRHIGLRELLGRDLGPVLTKAFYGREHAKIMQFARERGLRTESRADAMTAAEEYIVNLAETRQENTLLQKVYAAIRDFLRRMGFKIELADVDLRDIVSRAGSLIERGERRVPKGAVTLSQTTEPATEQPVFARRPSGVTGPVTFSDPRTEARYRASRTGMNDPRRLPQRMKEWFAHVGAGFTRHYIDMPNIPEYAKAHEMLRQYEAAPQAAKEKAVGILKEITKDMTPAEYDLFTRKVILDDLAFEDSQQHQLPFGFTSKTLANDKAAVDQAVKASPKVEKALFVRKRFLDRVTDQLVDKGILSADQIKNPAYFRHQVLTYARIWQYTQGSSKLKKPKPGYAKRRHGSEEDINANYLEAEFEFLHRALIDVKAAETIERIQDEYDIKEMLKQKAAVQNKGKPDDQKVTWRDIIPDDYTAWQPDKGNSFFLGQSIGEKAINHILETLATNSPQVATAELTEVLDGIRSALMVGGKKREMVIPHELAATLDEMRPNVERGFMDHLFSVPLGAWKQWVLINPRRVLRYNLNNLSGDLDAIIAGSPKAVRKLPQAIRELYQIQRGKAVPSARYREAIARGVFDSGLTIQEIPDINFLKKFDNLIGGPKVTEIPGYIAMRVWRALKEYTQFRENWMRYAAYLDYVERLEKGESMESIGYGATNPDIVDQIKDHKDKAALLARDMVGDYGNISAFGQEIRRKLIPFYSWVEINTGRYLRLIANAYGQGLGKGLGTTATIGAIKGARITAWLYVRMAILYLLVQMFNNLMFPDDEEALSPTDRTRLHLLMGKDKDGKIRMLRFQGALSDFLAWFGFDEAVGTIGNIEKGRASWFDVVQVVAKAPVNKIVGGITPLIKTPVELASGKSFYPDVFNPRRVYDKPREMFRLFSLDPEYDWLTGNPMRGYAEQAEGLLFYKRDVGEIAFYQIYELQRQYMRGKGVEGGTDFSTPKSRAIRKLRLAKRYEDKEAAAKAMDELREIGVRPYEVTAAIRRMRPLSGLSVRDRNAFMQTLDAKEMQLLNEANEYYRRVYEGG